MKNKIIKKCKNCKKEFISYINIDKKYCSKKCYTENQNSNKIKSFCSHCRKEIHLTLRRYESYNEHFCNKDCHAKFKTIKNKVVI